IQPALGRLAEQPFLRDPLAVVGRGRVVDILIGELSALRRGKLVEWLELRLWLLVAGGCRNPGIQAYPPGPGPSKDEAGYPPGRRPGASGRRKAGTPGSSDRPTLVGRGLPITRSSTRGGAIPTPAGIMNGGGSCALAGRTRHVHFWGRRATIQ